jgi:uncharacterized protein (TIGR03067 family)
MRPHHHEVRRFAPDLHPTHQSRDGLPTPENFVENSKIRQDPLTNAGYRFRRWPDPKNPDQFRVRVIERPSERVALVRVIGTNSANRLLAGFQQLMDWGLRHGLVPHGEHISMSQDDPDVTPLSKDRYDFSSILTFNSQPTGATMNPTSATVLLLGMTMTGLVPSRDAATKAGYAVPDGKWQAVEAELAGKEFPPEVTRSIQLTIDGEKYLVTTSEGEDRGTVCYLPDAKPSAMDITGTMGPNKGKTFLAIYKLEGERLIVCYDLGGKARPKEFKTEARTMLFLVTYRKLKS